MSAHLRRQSGPEWRQPRCKSIVAFPGAEPFRRKKGGERIALETPQQWRTAQMEIFVTRSALKDGGLPLLGCKNTHCSLTITDKQLEYLRKKTRAADTQFYNEIEQIKKDTGLCVVADPNANPADLPLKFRETLASIIRRRTRNLNLIVFSGVREDALHFMNKTLRRSKPLQRNAALIHMLWPLDTTSPFSAPPIFTICPYGNIKEVTRRPPPRTAPF